MIIINTVLLVLFILSISKLKNIQSKDNELNKFSLEATEPLRGILVILVMLCHIVPNVHWGFFNELGNYGALAVSVFFFISGYGLFKSLISKNDYLDNFLSKRFSKLLPPIIIVTIIFVALELFIGDGITLRKMIGNFIQKGKTFSPNAWYVYAIILYYLIFYIIFKTTKNKIKGLVLITMFTLVYIVAIKQTNWDACWYMSSICFPMGMIYVYNEDRIKRIFYAKTIYIVYATCISILLYCGIGTYLHWPGWGTIMYNLVPLIIMPLMYTIKFDKATILRFTGKISYELYIVHGIFIYYWRDCISSDTLFVISVISISYITAFCLKKVCSFIN